MNPQNPQNQPQPVQPQTQNPLSSMQAGEREIFQIKRHPIGIIMVYFTSTLALLVVAVVIFGVAPMLLPNSSDMIIKFGSLVFLILLLLTLGFVGVSHIIYWGNRWILTSDSLTQVTQFSLFNKQSSQLSLANLEDVTAQTNGVLAKMFKFGILKVETAGERSKFTFLYCPDPEKYAQQILMAREQFEQGRHYEQEGGVQQPQQSAQPVQAFQPPQAPLPPQAPPPAV